MTPIQCGRELAREVGVSDDKCVSDKTLSQTSSLPQESKHRFHAHFTAKARLGKCEMKSQTATDLKRGLSARHIRFMALGSAIGTGLFYGSASAIKLAGPA